MWYVNTYNKGKFEVIDVMFYINYVVCKSTCLCIFISYFLCFILTMWYVNGKGVKIMKDLNKVLY